MTTGSEEERAERAERVKTLKALAEAVAKGMNGSGGGRSYGYANGKAAEEAEAEVEDDGSLPFNLHDVADIGDLSKLPPTEFILGDQFAKGYVSSLVAPGASGKTAVRIAQALSIASGRELTGETLHMRCKVLFLCFEDGEIELKKRFGAAMRHHGIEPEDVRGWLHFAAPGRSAGKLTEADPKTGKAVEGRLGQFLERAIKATGAEFICLDPLKKLHGVDENSNSAMDEVIGLLSDLAIRLNVAVDAPQHARKHMSKEAPEAGSADQARGASSTVDAMRLVFTQMRMGAKEASQFDIPEDRRKSYVRIDPAKVNIAPPSREAVWFRLTGVRLDNATDSYDRSDHIVVAERWHPPSLWTGVEDPDTQERILTEIRQGMGDGDLYSRAPQAGKRCVSIAFAKHSVRKDAKEARAIVDEWIRRGMLDEKDYTNADHKKAKGLCDGPMSSPFPETATKPTTATKETKPTKPTTATVVKFPGGGKDKA